MRFALILFFLFAATAFSKSEDINGRWITANGDSHVVIEERDGKFFGTIVWLKEPVYPWDHKFARQEIMDTENPDEKLRKRNLIGLEFLKDFEYKKGKYINGKIYDPKSGKLYYCKLKIKEDKLHVRGSLDKFGMAGKTQIWKKILE